MQEAQSALVLNLEAQLSHAMDETSIEQTRAPNTAEASGAVASDEHLMLAFSKGATDAFTELFSRYKQPIYGFFRRRVAESANAEELTQETFLALLRAGPRYEPRALFRTYLYAIGFKILRVHRRKAAFRATFFGDCNFVPDPGRPDATESGLWVRRAVEKLEPIDREILLLREFDQLSYAQIAGLLELPVNTVRSRLFRARTALRKLLDPPAGATTEGTAQNDGETGERS
jgi:RNA polymerase sigma-70 factor (ECF subfamily)